ncbi:MAG TPA: cysteine desulfurase family protein [Planctomycetaceae bacterium]|nr:cysteine desulfurase family protein [Planctomycetaceae bacterium]
MTGRSLIYLDNNATTRPHPDVVELMSRHWRDSFANPGSRHLPGRRARQVLEQARESMAAILGADSDEVIFTSGGTESNNMALLGLARGAPGRIALTAGEHPSVMETCRFLEGQGWGLQILPVDEEGLLRPPAKDQTWLAADVRLAAVILAHNETGVIQDLGELAGECRSRGTPLHVDAVQAVGKIPVSFRLLGASSLALGAHKFHGPRGVGALLLRRGVKLAATAFGGHQESGKRPGTEAVPLIAGMARALELFAAEEERRTIRLCGLRDRLEQGLVDLCRPVVINGSRQRRLPNTLNVAFPGIDGEALLVALDLAGIACSLGSTCASGSAEPAPVLIAMNRSPDVLRSSIRFSVGIDNTDDEIDQAVRIIARAVNQMRNFR